MGQSLCFSLRVYHTHTRSTQEETTAPLSCVYAYTIKTQSSTLYLYIPADFLCHISAQWACNWEICRSKLSNFRFFVWFMFQGRKSWCVYTKTAGENFERDKNLVAFAESSKCFVLWESYNISSPRFLVSVFLRFLLVSGAGIKFNRWNEI
jgi:hypothetical protein